MIFTFKDQSQPHFGIPRTEPVKNRLPCTLYDEKPQHVMLFPTAHSCRRCLRYTSFQSRSQRSSLRSAVVGSIKKRSLPEDRQTASICSKSRPKFSANRIDSKGGTERDSRYEPWQRVPNRSHKWQSGQVSLRRDSFGNFARKDPPDRAMATSD